MHAIPSNQSPLGETPKPPSPRRGQLGPFDLPNQKLKKLLVRIDFRHPISQQGRLRQHGEIFRWRIIQMQDEVAALIEIPKFADVDKSLGVEPLQGMLVPPVDRHRVGLEGVRELFRCPAWRQPVLKCDVESVLRDEIHFCPPSRPWHFKSYVVER